MVKRKICIVTAARSEYGLLKWVIKHISSDPGIIFQLVVTGSHLSEEFGFTYKEIEADAYTIDEKVNMHLETTTQKGIAKSMGYCAIGMAESFDRLRPDILLVLGDRYELLPVCSAALLMNIPIAHISGGDITEGAIDDQVRHSVSKMASLHFPGSEDSAKRLVQMGESPATVFNVGELGIDGVLKTPLIPKHELAKQYGLDENLKWILFTYHPESKISAEENILVVANIIQQLKGIDNAQVMMSYANADFGGAEINNMLNAISIEMPEKFKIVKSFGYTRYINMLRYSFCMIGNSSSGFFEAPSVPLPVINIGNRQKGRMSTANIINVPGNFPDLKERVNQIMSAEFASRLKQVENPYGNGEAGKKIADILRTIDLKKMIKMGFYTGN